MKNFLKNNLWALLLIAAGTIWGLLLMDQLPAQVPTHFNTEGVADRFSSKLSALIMLPLTSLAVVLFTATLQISPKLYSAEHSHASIGKMNASLAWFLMSIHVIMLYEGLGKVGLMAKFLPVGLSFFIMLLGNYLSKIEKNMIIGLRLPWTLASDENWKQTHRFTARCYVFLGAISLVVSLLIQKIHVPLAALILASVLGSIYSYRYFKKQEVQSA